MVWLTAMVNLRLKFAETREAATRDLKRLVDQVFRRLSIAANVVALIFNVVSTEPLTRWTVFMIAFQISALIAAWTMDLMKHVTTTVTDAVRRIAETQGQQIENTDRLIKVVERLAAAQAED